MKSWKISFCTSLFFHLLLLSLFLKIGLGNARSFYAPEPIEVELGSPMAGMVGNGNGRKAAPEPALAHAGPARTATSPPRQKAELVNKIPSASVSMPHEAAPSAAFGEPGMKRGAEAVPGPSPTGDGAASGHGTTNGRTVGVLSGSAKGNGGAGGGTSGNGNGGAPDTLPYVIRGPAPAYPPEARSKGLTGRVRVKVLIGEQGMVRNAFVAGSSGHPVLDEAALNGLRHWLFGPAHRDGRAVAAWVVVPVLFRLD